MTYDSKIAMLGGAIDYAGTFPPAALSLDGTLSRAAKWHQEGKHPWLMNKVVLPVGDIKNISAEKLYSLGANGSPWLFAALGTPSQSESASDFYKTVEWDLRELRRCREKGYYSSCRQEVVSYETKLPNSLSFSSSPSKIYDFISPVLERTASLTSNEVRDLFFEISFDGDWRTTIENTSQVLADWMDENDELDLVPGLKFRTGGNYTPTFEQLGLAVAKVTAHGLRFKATQGLHRAVTHGKSFGFVNLFAAINFAQGYGPVEFGPDEIEQCLAESQSKNFEFQKDKFCWKNFSMTLDEIEVARRSHGAAFGSCSLDEPDEDLLKEFP